MRENQEKSAHSQRNEIKTMSFQTLSNEPDNPILEDICLGLMPGIVLQNNFHLMLISYKLVRKYNYDSSIIKCLLKWLFKKGHLLN